MKLGLPKNLSFQNISAASVLSWLRKASRYLLALFFFGVLTWLGYFWYSSVYGYEWSQEQKTQYRNEYAGQTTFRAERFQRTSEVLEERMRLHQTVPAVKKDIFLGISF